MTLHISFKKAERKGQFEIETEEYMDNPDNSGIYAINTVANNDTDIIPFLYEP